MLQQFAATHNVKAVTVLIGANNYGFADIVQTCIEDFLLSPSWWPNYCNDDSNVKAYFTSSSIATQTADIKGAILNVRQAMLNDGYADSSYKIIVQTYSSPIPNGSGFRYSQSGYTRQSTGGCGFWNNDANWANSTAVPTIDNSVKQRRRARPGSTNYVILDDQNALVGHRLCENTVGLLEEKGVANWTEPGRGRQDGVGQPDPHDHARCSGRTSSRRTRTRTTGASSRCGTACARPTTAARRAAARARSHPPASTRSANRR